MPSNIVPSSGNRMSIPESTSDFKDWLEGIKMVARLPGGMPIEFRRKVSNQTNYPSYTFYACVCERRNLLFHIFEALACVGREIFETTWRRLGDREDKMVQ